MFSHWEVGALRSGFILGGSSTKFRIVLPSPLVSMFLKHSHSGPEWINNLHIHITFGVDQGISRRSFIYNLWNYNTREVLIFIFCLLFYSFINCISQWILNSPTLHFFGTLNKPERYLSTHAQIFCKLYSVDIHICIRKLLRNHFSNVFNIGLKSSSYTKVYTRGYVYRSQ